MKRRLRKLRLKSEFNRSSSFSYQLWLFQSPAELILCASLTSRRVFTSLLLLLPEPKPRSPAKSSTTTTMTLLPTTTPSPRRSPPRRLLLLLRRRT